MLPVKYSFFSNLDFIVILSSVLSVGGSVISASSGAVSVLLSSGSVVVVSSSFGREVLLSFSAGAVSLLEGFDVSSSLGDSILLFLTL